MLPVRRIITLSVLLTLLLLVYTSISHITSRRLLNLHPAQENSEHNQQHHVEPYTRPPALCSPEEWSNGHWAYTPHSISIPVESSEDAMEYSGFRGCASHNHHISAALGADTEEIRALVPNRTSYHWTPSSDCSISPLDGGLLVKELVEQGGWLLLGGEPPCYSCLLSQFRDPRTIDSITDNQFFSLSCILYPHVIGPENENQLYLNPASPLISEFNFPEGFDIATTPLVSFRRLDLLYDLQELVDHYQELYNPPPDFTLFNDNKPPAYSFSPKEYIPMFTAPLPLGGYSTLITSTAGHWTPGTFRGLLDSSKPESGSGMDKITDFFRHVATRWAAQIQDALSDSERAGSRRGRSRRRVIARAYLPGHEECHSYTQPWTVYNSSSAALYNWPWIKDINKVFQVRRQHNYLLFNCLSAPPILSGSALVLGVSRFVLPPY